MSRLALALFATLIATTTVTHAARPPEAIDADRQAAQSEVQDLERRARALSTQLDERRDHLKRRLRALYKMSRGGTLRVLAGAEDGQGMSRRYDAARRLLERDLSELKIVGEEARQLDLEQARRQTAVARALALGDEVALAEVAPPTGLAAAEGRLRRPVPGPLVGRFGAYRDDEGLMRARRGIELRSRAAAPVRAIAAGRVRWVGEAPGLGRAVLVDHGEGYLTLTGRLDSVRVAVGDAVSAGSVIADAVGSQVYFELAQGGTPIDPSSWLAPPGRE